MNSLAIRVRNKSRLVAVKRGQNALTQMPIGIAVQHEPIVDQFDGYRV